MMFLLMLAASASFASPFGYQTNLMVLGAGGYVFGDFVRLGVPLQALQMVVSIAVVRYAEHWCARGAPAWGRRRAGEGPAKGRRMEESSPSL